MSELLFTCGFEIHTTHEDLIIDNARDRGLDPDKIDWDKLNEEISILETRALKQLRSELNLRMRDEGHGNDDALIGTATGNAFAKSYEIVSQMAENDEREYLYVQTDGLSRVARECVDVDYGFFNVEIDEKDLLSYFRERVELGNAEIADNGSGYNLRIEYTHEFINLSSKDVAHKLKDLLSHDGENYIFETKEEEVEIYADPDSDSACVAFDTFTSFYIGETNPHLLEDTITGMNQALKDAIDYVSKLPAAA